MKFIVITSILCILMLEGFSQNGLKNSKLKSGDRLPDIPVKNLLFYKYPGTKSASELHKGKLLILDFWGPYCSVCIESMPKLAALKKTFGDKLEVVLVTSSTQQVVDSFFRKRAGLKDLRIPMIVNDSVLGKKLFPHVTLPHIVWVTENGMVHAITSGDYVTAENIKKVLAGDSFKHITKSDTVNMDNNKHLVAGGEKDFIYRSVITKSLNGNITTMASTPANPVYVKEPRYKRILFTKFCVLDLFMAAVYKLKIPTTNKFRYVIETKDTIKYVNPSRFAGMYQKTGYQNFNEWAIDYAYNYELVLPTEVGEHDFFEAMLGDLNKAFDVTGSLETRPAPCYIIVNKLNTKFATKGQEPKFIYIPGKTKSGYFEGIQNKSITELVELLNRFNKGIPIIDESAIKETVDMPININVNDPDMHELKLELNKVGLDLVKGIRPVEMLVLKDKIRP